MLRTYTEDLPNRFCAVHHHDEDVRKTAARCCWESFEVIIEYESCGALDPFFRELTRALLWPLMGWCRDMPEDVLQEIQNYAAGLGTSVPNEHHFNTARKRMRSSPKLRLDPKGMWHSALHSNIKENVMIEVTIRSEGKEQDVLPNSALHSRSLQILLGLEQAARAQDHAFLALPVS